MLKFRIYSKKIVTKTGQTFYAYSYTRNGEKYWTIKFRKEVNAPQEQGYFLVETEAKDMNIHIAKKDGYDRDTIWVKKVNLLVKDDDYLKEKRQEEEKQLNEIFGDDLDV